MDHATEPRSTTTRGLRAQIGRFVVIGIASTAAYVVLYGGLRAVLSAFSANAVALVVTAIGNTAANRRLTFGVRDRASVMRHQVAGLAAFGIALAITSVAVALLFALAPRAGRPLEIAVLVGANAIATAGGVQQT
jgi:putative flippase GtrA